MNFQPEILSQLSPETLAALMEFYEEKNINIKEDNYDKIDEDWELSQFWYTKETADNIIKLIANYAEKNKKVNIALLCTPSLYRAYLRNKNQMENLNVALFEFDKRFSIFEDAFNFYDLNKPLDIDKIHHNKYDIIVADPPFLNEETIHKVSETMRLISNENGIKIFITGIQVEDSIIKEFPELKLTNIKIEHDKKRLQNPFGFFCAIDLENN
jgi:ribosomal protein L33